MPFDSIAIVGREFVVEIVIPLAERDNSCDDVVARRIAVVEWLVTKPMG